MKNVLIAWTRLQDPQSNNKFKDILSTIVTSVKTKTFFTDTSHISFVETREDLEKYVHRVKVDVLICDENLGGEHIGVKTLKGYKNYSEDMNVILVIGDEKKSKGKVMGLYQAKFFNCLFTSDLKPEQLASRLVSTRSEQDAFAYYGLDEYEDLFNGSKATPKPEPQKIRPEKNSRESEPIQESISTDAVDIEYIGTEESETPAKSEPVKKLKPKEEKKPKATAEKEAVKDAPGASVGEEETEMKEQPVSSMAEPAENILQSSPKAEPEPAKAEPEQKAAPKKKKKKQQDEQQDELTTFESPVNLTATAEEVKDINKVVRDEEADAKVVKRMDALSGEDVAKLLLNDKNLDDVLAFISEKSKEAMQVVSVERQESPTDVVLDQLLTFYTEKDNTFLRNLRDGIMTKEEFEEDLMRRISMYDVTDIQAHEIFTKFEQFMWGYDVLETYITDKNVSDIKVVSPEHVQIKWKGKKKPVELQFRSGSHYRSFVSRLAHRNHVDIHNNDIAIFTDTKSFDDVRLRVNITTEYINSSGYPTLHIRKINNIKYSTEELINAGMFGPRTAAYLINAAQNYSGIVFTGKGSAGKTTLMNWLIDYIPKDMSGLCIQESDELFSKTHPFIQFQRVTTNADGKKAYDLKALSINGLLTDIDYFIIGESKGAECKYFTNAAYTGNRCWTSVHSPNSHGALPKIADYAKYESDYTKDDILQMLTSLQCVVFLKNFKVAQISEVMGWDSDKREIIYKDIPLDDPSDYTSLGHAG